MKSWLELACCPNCIGCRCHETTFSAELAKGETALKAWFERKAKRESKAATEQELRDRGLGSLWKY